MHPLSRLLTALFGLWFAVVIGDPGVLHACPMHGGHGTAHSSAMMSSAHAAHTAHGEHGSSASDASAVTGAGHHETTPAPCTCVGHCCATAAVAPVPLVATMRVPEVVAHAGPKFPTPSCDVAASPDRRLPFANGPPTA